MSYSESQNSSQASNSFTRIDDYFDFLERFGGQTFQSKEWELIRVKKTDTYILLNSEITTNLFATDELKVTIIPLTSIGDYYASNYSEKQLYLKVWGVEIDLIQGNVKFAHDMSFEIKPKELRNKGLGSYVLGKLVRWVKEHPSDFKIQLHAQSIDESYPDNSNLVEGLYQKFNLLEAKTILDIREPPASDKIESILLAEFLSDIIRENNMLEQNKHNLQRRIQELYDSYSDQILKNNLIIRVLITIIVVLGLITYIS